MAPTWAGQTCKRYYVDDHTDLSGALLSGVDLSGLDLRGMNLSGANLERAKLSNTYLNEANLKGANLSCADLRGADLDETLNLRQEEINAACLDEETSLPPGFTRPLTCPPAPQGVKPPGQEEPVKLLPR